jgi:tetrapyrrole methylase family protein/MazG family protein
MPTPEIIIVGLGPGSADLLTRAAWRALTTANVIYARTRHHPTLAELPAHVQVQSFDDVYDQAPDFETVYQTIADRVLALAQQQSPVVYAVPGHPFVAETAVRLICQQAPAAGLQVQVLDGLSFIEPVLSALQLDALPGLVIGDALACGKCYHPPFDTNQPVLLAQIYSRLIAADLKLTLLNLYPPEHQVALLHHLGTPQQQITWLPLYQIDHSDTLDQLSSLFIPALPAVESLTGVLNTVAHLRSPEGCPWDQEQTHLSLRRYLLEESYEVLEALDTEDVAALQDELGDLLLQILLHTQIAVDDSEFQLPAVLGSLNRKLIRRHPHVFGSANAESSAQVVTQWAQIKAAERQAQGKTAPTSLLGDVKQALPALAHAQQLQRLAKQHGFDWPTIADVVAKVQEELAEVQAAADPSQQAAEIGDLLFTVVNWARWLQVDAESALRHACTRFHQRVETVAELVAATNRPVKSLSAAELDDYWIQAKQRLT